MAKPSPVIRYAATRLPGRWKLGFALDVHTKSSTFAGYDEFGHERFDTVRSQLGELLYQLKYHNDQTAVSSIARTAASFVQKRRLNVDCVVPVPASQRRANQPVSLLASALGKELAIPVVAALKKSRNTPELKAIHDFDERIKLLENAIELTAEAKRLEGSQVLLFDDLWRSGATLNAAATVLAERADAAEFFALTITRTRSNQ